MILLSQYTLAREYKCMLLGLDFVLKFITSMHVYEHV